MIGCEQVLWWPLSDVATIRLIIAMLLFNAVVAVVRRQFYAAMGWSCAVLLALSRLCGAS